MGLREDKAELLSKLFMLEKDKNALEVKLKYVETQQRAQSATLKNLQGQLKDTEALLALATQNKVRFSVSKSQKNAQLQSIYPSALIRLLYVISEFDVLNSFSHTQLFNERKTILDFCC